MSKHARWPQDDPRFCSAACAARRALENTMDTQWCYPHGEWHHRGETCPLDRKSEVAQ